MRQSTLVAFLLTLVGLGLAACGGGGGGDAAAPADTGSAEPAAPPKEEVLGRLRFSGGGGGGTGTDRVDIGALVELGPDSGAPAIVTPLVTNLDVGREFEFKAGSSAAIDAWLFLLTNGIDDRVHYFARLYPSGMGGGGGTNEVHGLEDRDPRLGLVDLQGAQITRVVIKVTEFKLKAWPGRFEQDGSFEITFWGHVHFVLPDPVGPGPGDGVVDPIPPSLDPSAPPGDLLAK